MLNICALFMFRLRPGMSVRPIRGKQNHFRFFVIMCWTLKTKYCNCHTKSSTLAPNVTLDSLDLLKKRFLKLFGSFEHSSTAAMSLQFYPAVEPTCPSRNGGEHFPPWVNKRYLSIHIITIPLIPIREQRTPYLPSYWSKNTISFTKYSYFVSYVSDLQANSKLT